MLASPFNPLQDRRTFEGADIGGGGGNGNNAKTVHNETIGEFLALASEACNAPSDDKFLIWLYTILTIDPSGIKQSDFDKIDIAKTGYAYIRETVHSFYEAYDDLYQGINYGRSVPSDLTTWKHQFAIKWDNDIYVEETKGKSSYYTSGFHVVFRDYDYVFKREKINDEHQFHLGVRDFISNLTRVKLDDVLSFIDNPNPKKEIAKTNFSNAALEIAIPKPDADSITEKAKGLTPNSRAEISGFGNDIAIEAAKITSELARYFTQQAAKPNHTIELVHKIISEAQDMNISGLIKSDPNWFSRKLRKPKLVPVDQMPLYALTNQAMKLPDMAAIDNEAFGHDLKIADHAMHVLNGYYKLLKTHKDSLKKEKTRLKKASKDSDDLITQVISATIPALIDQRLHELTLNMEFIKNNAFNFSQISDMTTMVRSQLSTIAELATTIQTPAMNAIHQFNAYQVRYLQQFGEKVNDGVLEQFNISASELISLEKDATPQLTKDNILKGLSDLSKSMENLPANLLIPINERGAIAASIQKDVVKKSLPAPALQIGGDGGSSM